MLRKMLGLTAAVWCVAVVGATAYPINWFPNDTGSIATPGGADPQNWVICVYKDGGDGRMSGFAPYDGVSGAPKSLGDDTFVLSQKNTTSGALDWYYAFNGQTVPDGINIFTVVFNKTTLAAVDNTAYFVIPDTALFAVPSSTPQTPKDYNCGSASAGQWQAVVPEPSALALMALGLSTLAARALRRRR